VITCIHPILPPFDDLVRQRVEDIKDKSDNLLVILESEGGSVETCERIANAFRHHYAGEISFLVPNFAMSAGTILVMVGDRILMDYYSILGPIDPQIQNTRNDWVPAVGYLEKYNEFIRISKKRNLTQAELAFFLDNFDAGQIHRFEQAREHGVDLLKLWLAQYKFKNWTKTRTRGLTVTPQMRTKRAAEIANKLNNTKLWRTHGRGISIDVIRNTLNLMIEDFGTEPSLAELNKSIRSYYRLLQDYMQRRGWDWVVMTRLGHFAI
jgi:Serine dehydrogenase proteinase